MLHKYLISHQKVDIGVIASEIRTHVIQIKSLNINSTSRFCAILHLESLNFLWRPLDSAPTRDYFHVLAGRRIARGQVLVLPRMRIWSKEPGWQQRWSWLMLTLVWSWWMRMLSRDCSPRSTDPTRYMLYCCVSPPQHHRRHSGAASARVPAQIARMISSQKFNSVSQLDLH